MWFGVKKWIIFYLLLIKEQNIIVSFNVVNHLWDKLVPDIAYVIAAINGHPIRSLFLFLLKLISLYVFHFEIKARV